MKKTLTFSYDDGVIQDIRLVALLNRYSLKATFNLNSGSEGSGSWQYKGAHVRRLTREEMRDLYTGHEIAVHTLNHPHLEVLSPEEAHREIALDKANLEEWFRSPIIGMAYPYGTWNDTVIREAQACGIRYARTTVSTHDFSFPKNPYEWHITCHHDDPSIFSFIDTFVKAEPECPMLFSIFGHSYELDGDSRWDHFERICRLLSGHDDIAYCTNAQALRLV